MSTTVKILLGLSVVFFLIGGSFVMFVFGVKNTCVRMENGIDAQYDQNQANLAGYTNKIMDMVQVPAMAKNAIKEIAQAAIQGRYGEKGSQALFQAIQEQNPTVDASLYRTLMQGMEAGRNSFDADQKTIIDKCNVYKNYYESEPQASFAGFFGYPKYDKTKCKPVITEQTAQDFKTKRTGPLQLQTQ